MQVVRNLTQRTEKNVWRKLREMALAQGLEREVGKDNVLGMYLDAPYLGQRGNLSICGFQAGNRFGKSSIGRNRTAALRMLAKGKAPRKSERGACEVSAPPRKMRASRMNDAVHRCLLDDLVDYNRTAWRAADSAPMPAHAARALCIIACHDPRLTRLLPQALGIERGDAVLIRIPGAAGLPDSTDLVRSVAAAVYLNHCREVLVLGHTDCAIHRVTTSALLDAMAARGVGRDTVPHDVRHFFGLRTDVRATVLDTARSIREAAFIPRDTRVHTAIIDTHTGMLQVLERDDRAQAVRQE
jgi:carbonic anhydrase